MLNYSTVITQGLRMAELSNQKFDESQLVRMDHILYAKESGDQFLLIKQALETATKTSPIELPGVGTFTSFANFLEYIEETTDFSASTIKEYVKLAENWHIVLKLNMQDKENVENYGNCMRINRTLKIIRWYEKVESIYPPEKLTLEQYWIDEEAKLSAAREAKAEREQQEKQLKESYSQLQARLALVENELEHLRRRNVPIDDYNTLLSGYREKVKELEVKAAEVEALKAENARLKAMTQAKPFMPPTVTQPMAKSPFTTTTF